MLIVNFDPFPVLITERLRLRRVTAGDVDEVFALRSDPEVMYFIPRPLAKTKEDALKHIAKIDEGITQNESINWAITLKENDKLIGMLCFVRMSKENYRAEIGYLLHPGQHGKGIMNEAIAPVIEYGFSGMKLHSIEAVVDPLNVSSVRVLERNNFVKEGYFKERDYYHGKFNDISVYSLLTGYPSH